MVVIANGVAFSSALERAEFAAADSTQEFGNFFLSRFLDLRISYDEFAQTCTVALPYAPHLCNPQGSMHGGIIATALDVSMGHLCEHFLSTAMTLEMQVRYFRPLKGDGRCIGTVLRAGRRIVHLESRLFDEDDRLVAFAVGSWHRLDAL
ncbi:PaaI family thioesterase [Cryobacterium sp. Y29]|uniref:PaaI family thioesterase n=1 Tax=Cryobacterium sp. Y29 TaxID=2048285 RepID=UPI000CE2BC04|nr:PaaI family thioesterase [Cryobacterium sp. Y29]